MVIATAERENTWKVRSIPGDSTLLEFISIGSGPDEFVSSPLISQASFLMVMEIYTYFYLIIIGSNFERLIFQKSIDSGQMESDVERIILVLLIFLFIVTSLDTNTRIFVSVNPSEGSIERTILKDGSELSLNSIQHLNQYKVPHLINLDCLCPTLSSIVIRTVLLKY